MVSKTFGKHRGQISGLGGAALGVLILAFILVMVFVSFDKLSTVATKISGAGSLAANVVSQSEDAASLFVDFLPLIVLAIVMGAVITYLILRFGGMLGGAGGR